VGVRSELTGSDHHFVMIVIPSDPRRMVSNVQLKTDVCHVIAVLTPYLVPAVDGLSVALSVQPQKNHGALCPVQFPAVGVPVLVGRACLPGCVLWRHIKRPWLCVTRSDRLAELMKATVMETSFSLDQDEW